MKAWCRGIERMCQSTDGFDYADHFQKRASRHAHDRRPDGAAGTPTVEMRAPSEQCLATSAPFGIEVHILFPIEIPYFFLSRYTR